MPTSVPLYFAANPVVAYNRSCLTVSSISALFDMVFPVRNTSDKKEGYSSVGIAPDPTFKFLLPDTSYLAIKSTRKLEMTLASASS